MKLSQLLGATALASATFFLPQIAFAQTSEPAEQVDTTQTADGATEEEATIVVTGSRIQRPEADSPVPVAAISDTQIGLTGQQNISDVLNELPQVGIGSTRTNTNFLVSGTGVSTVNLRALGNSRTLTLVNGRRFIGGFAGDSAVDINNIPTDLVERIDIVTGGQSAVYGSDAIAGVVNFILRDDFNGITARAQTSLTERGDNARYFASITAGTTLGENGNVMINYSYDRDDGLRSRNRDISDQDCSGILCGPGAYSSYAPQGQFQLVNAAGDDVAAILPGGRAYFSFNPDNSVAYLTGYNTGAYGFNRNSLRNIAVPLERHLLTGIAKYEVTPGITAFFEGTYANVKSTASLEPTALDGDSDLGVGYSADNPFIPAPIAAQIAAVNSDADPTNDVGSISFRRRQNDVFDRSNRAQRETIRIATGLRGDVGAFNWEAAYVYGRLRDYNETEDIDAARYRNALDAVRVGPGNAVGVDIVCRDTAARAAGCIPINLFGYNTVDPRAAAYVESSVPRSEDIVNVQHVASFNVSGPIFDLWGQGSTAIAIGAEYRSEKTTDNLDVLTNAGGNSGNQLPDFVGGFDVWEAYGEINVPLLKDIGGVEYLGLNGAARYSDYSSIGSVFSWNAGAEYSPIPGVRFRGNYAVANRAPNNSELYSQPSETFASVTDPCNGITATTGGEFGGPCRAIPAIAAFFAANPGGTFEYTLAEEQQINGFVGGNTALQEETAKTYTVGLALSPVLLRGLTFTVDYYNIQIDQAIDTLGRGYSIEQCLLTSAPVYCSNVFRNPATGKVARVDGQLINVAGYKTDGIDFTLNYVTNLGLLGNDRFTFNGNYTWLLNFETQADPASPWEEAAGTFGLAYSSHRFNVRGTYTIDEFSVSWGTQFVSGGPYVDDPAEISANPAVQALNDIDTYWLHNAQLRWDTNAYSFFLGVDNVFDRKPQYLPGTPYGTPTGLETTEDFDVFGRRFTAGARIRF